MNNIQIVLLAAGLLQSEEEDYVYPSYLHEKNGETIIEKIVKNINTIKNIEIYIAFRESEIKKYRLNNVIKNISEFSKIISIPDQTLGSACTALFVSSQLKQQLPLLILSANEIIQYNLNEIIESLVKNNNDAGTVVFKSTHPRYSYVKLSNEGSVIEAAQKNPISNIATTGFFYFSTAELFVSSAKKMILKNASTEGLFYIAPVFNELILNDFKVGVFEIDQSSYIPLKNEAQLQSYQAMVLK